MTELLVFSIPKHPSVPAFSSLPICNGLLYSWSSQISTEKRLVKLKHQKTSDLKRILISSCTKCHLDLVARFVLWHWGLCWPPCSPTFCFTCTNTRKPSSCRAFQCWWGFCPAQQHRHHTSSFSSFMLDGETRRHRNPMLSLASMGLILKFLKPVSPGILNP